MDFKVHRPINGVLHLKFRRQEYMTRGLLRMQEHHESPKFRGKVFSVSQYRDWCKSTEKDGNFDYFTRVQGFNLPSSALRAFILGEFNPLGVEEKAILDALRQEPGRFYVIATYRSADIVHEMAHARWYLDRAYQKAAKDILKGSEVNLLCRKLAEDGYHRAVVLDEAHAYLLETPQYFEERLELKADDYAKVRQALKTLSETPWGSKQ